ncbi:MAG TPA: phosphomannomutase/phosphoglucomutase [Deltaproteobacteria bacterium]|nr:phosphomannomutase/phosphoglucomutase [Deltaproteobacteria bacterium]
MNPEVFREYDIRGVVGTDLDDGFVDGLARSLGVYFRERGVDRISLGMDARLSSPGFRDILKKGLTGSGVHVIDLGMVPTPVMYFSLFRLDVGGGVCVTGSHNPPDNNGFKIALGKMTIYGSEIQKIRAIMEEGRTMPGKASGSSCDIVPEYVDDIITRIRPGTTRLKVVVDPGNGVGGAPAMAVCNALGMEVSGICLEPDGRFPNHHPDPTTAEGLSMLRTEVIRQGADLGIGYDGDADRIGVIDARGNTVYGDMITAILARELLKDKPGEKIIGEVKCSKAFYDEVARAGGIPIMGKVGHSPMKARLMEEKAALAGEMSGHIFFLDRWYGFDDAIYTSARLLEILSRQTEPQAVFDRLPAVVNTPEIRIECPDRIKFDVVERFIAYARSRYDDCVDIDGVRFTRGDTWGLVRPSNTQPVIVLRFEARDRDALEKIEADTRGRLDLIIRDLEAAS